MDRNQESKSGFADTGTSTVTIEYRRLDSTCYDVILEMNQFGIVV